MDDNFCAFLILTTSLQFPKDVDEARNMENMAEAFTLEKVEVSRGNNVDYNSIEIA